MSLADGEAEPLLGQNGTWFSELLAAVSRCCLSIFSFLPSSQGHLWKEESRRVSIQQGITEWKDSQDWADLEMWHQILTC